MQGMEDRIPPPERFEGAIGRAHEQAAEKFGADDFGPDDYLTGLGVLLMSMDYDPHFSPRGRAVAWGSLVGALAARAFSVREMQRRPDFDGHPIIEPVVITGIPRTGTTALHKLLAVDRQFQGLEGWLMATPMPRPPRQTWASNPFFQEAVERLEVRYAATPDKRAAHLMAADEVDECLFILRQGFVSNGWACGFSSATYDLWWQTQDELPSYQWLYRTYQLIGANEPHKRWLLKNPGHIDNLDSLFAVFPDAKVIVTHRDPAKAIPSLCSVLIRNHRVMEEDRYEQRARIMGIRETEKWGRAVRRAKPGRDRHPTQILDIMHSDLHREPIRTVERIYAFAGLELQPAVRVAMEQRIADAPEAAYGEHRYNVADFGTTEDAIRDRFRDYIEEFGLAPRPAIGAAR